MATEGQNFYSFSERLEYLMSTHQGPDAGESDRGWILGEITFLGGRAERKMYNQKVTMSNYNVSSSLLS